MLGEGFPLDPPSERANNMSEYLIRSAAGEAKTIDWKEPSLKRHC